MNISSRNIVLVLYGNCSNFKQQFLWQKYLGKDVDPGKTDVDPGKTVPLRAISSGLILFAIPSNVFQFSRKNTPSYLKLSAS